MKVFIRANTRLAPVVGLCSGNRAELLIWQADEIAPIWSATEADLARQGLDPPFWAFPWAGGQAVAAVFGGVRLPGAARHTGRGVAG